MLLPQTQIILIICIKVACDVVEINMCSTGAERHGGEAADFT